MNEKEALKMIQQKISDRTVLYACDAHLSGSDGALVLHPPYPCRVIQTRQFPDQPSSLSHPDLVLQPTTLYGKSVASTEPLIQLQCRKLSETKDEANRTYLTQLWSVQTELHKEIQELEQQLENRKRDWHRLSEEIHTYLKK